MDTVIKLRVELPQAAIRYVDADATKYGLINSAKNEGSVDPMKICCEAIAYLLSPSYSSFSTRNQPRDLSAGFVSLKHTLPFSFRIPGMRMVNHNPVISQPGNSSGAAPLLLELVPGLKHDTDLAVEWSMEEQYKLEEGLNKI